MLLATTPAIILFLYWVDRPLRVVSGRGGQGGQRGPAPLCACIPGVAMALIAGVCAHVMLHDEAVHTVIKIARQQVPAGQRFFVSSIRFSGRHG